MPSVVTVNTCLVTISEVYASTCCIVWYTTGRWRVPGLHLELAYTTRRDQADIGIGVLRIYVDRVDEMNTVICGRISVGGVAAEYWV